MTTTMTFSPDHHTNTPTSIIIPLFEMVIQVILSQPQHINHQNASCVHCDQRSQHHASDEEKEKKEMNAELILLKREICRSSMI
ncbi:unnamed protein product [Adineta steineri]|uniref:Uncharacterized protein n=1 Tax=Adineta steineri TaxID=433720 RepID=A0A813S5R9_9BILA|nr:unnamed protein product [Adineta steineri]CAF1233422.1 unnamed protein product [Adineta steineri]CAF3746594.1 unnamed protein product [Adineta steineri]CAF3936666.1 unnamed protein product [Adineta steineri]